MIVLSTFILVILCFYFYGISKNLKKKHDTNITRLQSVFFELKIKNKLLKDKLFVSSSFERSYEVKSRKLRDEIVAMQKMLFQNIK